MSKHTPGPWVYDNCGIKIGNPETGFPVFRIIDDENHIVVTTQEAGTTGDNFHDCCARVEANARLIAAAPELLEVLKEVFEHRARSGVGGPLLKRICDVLDKAEGK